LILEWFYSCIGGFLDNTWDESQVILNTQFDRLDSEVDPSFKNSEDISNVHGRVCVQLGHANFVDTRKINSNQSNVLYASPHFFGLYPKNDTFTAK